MTTVTQHGPPLSAADLEQFEVEWGHRLPETYRTFLRETNGGLPDPNAIDVPGHPESPTDVQVFFGLGRAVASSDLRWNLETLGDRLEVGALPIARDSGGNVFCLQDGRAKGIVVYCDLEAVYGTFNELSPFYEVAKDFTSFLAALRGA